MRTRSGNGHLRYDFRSQALPILLVLIVGFLCLWNLSHYPLPWFDEGLNFQPPRNLVLHGQYALLSSEGFRVLDPALQTGPPVTLPIAFSFRVLGIGLLQARLVTSLFSILCVVIYYHIAQSLYGRAVGWLAAILLLTFAADDFVSFLYLGRQVLGEIPALFFFLSGLLIWFRSWERVEGHYLAGAGLLFGLAMVTKSQFTLLVPPTLLVVWLIGFFIFRTLRWRHLILPAMLCVGLVLIWYGLQTVIVGPQQSFLDLETLRAGVRLHVLSCSLATIRHSLGVLVRTGYVVWGGLGLAYALWCSRQRTLAALRRLALLAFVGLWLLWYTVASIGWARYAFVAVAVSHIFYAALLCDALAALAPLRRTGTRRHQLRIAFALALLLITGWMIASGYSVIRSVLGNRDESYFLFARYLDETIPPSAIVESWEWELDLITDLRYHHPPTSVTNAVTHRLWVDGSEDKTVYDFRQFEPDYLIVGRFARWTELYPPDFLEHKCALVKSIGDYDLYRVNVNAKKSK